MSSDWDFYFRRVDDRPASIFVDLGLKQDAPVRSHPTMAYLRILMRRPREDGLSSQEEYDELVALEDSVTARVVRDGTAIFVGRNTSGGTRDFFFYVADRARFENAARDAMRAFPAYEYDTGTRDDPNWRTYLEFLHPSLLELQFIMNGRVLRQLEKEGDNTTNARPINHVALFSSPEAQSAFGHYVRTEGFAIDHAPGEPNEDGHFTVEFSRADQPARIDEVVMPLVRKTTELGGEYDGWGCAIEP